MSGTGTGTGTGGRGTGTGGSGTGTDGGSAVAVIIASLESSPSHAKNEAITITNNSGADLDLSGWRIASMLGASGAGGKVIRLTGASVGAGATLKILIRRPSAGADFGLDLKQRFMNGAGDLVLLYDDQFREVDRKGFGTFTTP